MRVLNFFGVIVLLQIAGSVCAIDVELRKEIWQWAREVDGFEEFNGSIESQAPIVRAERLSRQARQESESSRLAAALVANAKVDSDAEILRELIEDPSPVVRCAAARSLFGAAAEVSETARKHHYSEVLAAEREARSILDSISSLIPRDQVLATRKLAALGYNAILAVRKYLSHEHNSVVLTALLVYEEITHRRANVPPKWHADVTRKLEKEITFEFVNKPLSEAAQEVALQTGVKIEVSEKPFDEPVNLRVKAMPAAQALAWIVRLASREVYIGYGQVFLTKQSTNCGEGYTKGLIDVRDLVDVAGEPDVRKALSAVQKGLSEFRIWNGFVVVSAVMDRDYHNRLNAALEEMRKKHFEK